MKPPPRGPTLRELVLPAGLADHLAAGHPWVYRDHVPRGFEAPSGTFLRIRSGNWSGIALWDEESQVAMRVFSRGRYPDGAFVEERVRAAWDLRQPLREQGITGFRLVYGEADGLPGVVVDSYDGYCVIVTYAKSLGVVVPELSALSSE